MVVARFVEGLRQANGIIAGISEMHWLKFLIFNVIGATLWVTTWASVGYFGGNHINAFLRYQLYFSLGVVVVLVASVGLRFYKKRLTSRARKT